jgi:capsular polysaccharide biosynthesis protein
MDQAKISSVAIIDAPRLESQAVFPKKIVFVAGGLAFGVALSALVILMSLSFGNTIITVEGAERILGAPVVAALPRMKALPAE